MRTDPAGSERPAGYVRQPGSHGEQTAYRRIQGAAGNRHEYPADGGGYPEELDQISFPPGSCGQGLPQPEFRRDLYRDRPAPGSLRRTGLQDRGTAGGRGIPVGGDCPEDAEPGYGHEDAGRLFDQTDLRIRACPGTGRQPGFSGIQHAASHLRMEGFQRERQLAEELRRCRIYRT